MADDEWRADGHELIGQRVARIFPTKRRHEERVSLGTIRKWVPEDEEAGDEARRKPRPTFHLAILALPPPQARTPKGFRHGTGDLSLSSGALPHGA